MSLFVNLHINSRLYLKDPGSSQTGIKILDSSVKIFLEQGTEHFTFKRLAEASETVESTVYRYFENKHNLLVYLSSWYWACMDFSLDYETRHIQTAEHRLRKAIELMTGCCVPDISLQFSDLSQLRNLMVAEHAKVYMTHDVLEENKDGFFFYLKSFTNKIAALLNEMHPDYPHAHSLAFTLIITVLQQLYVIQKLPSLSSIKEGVEREKQLTDFVYGLAIHAPAQWRA